MHDKRCNLCHSNNSFGEIYCHYRFIFKGINRRHKISCFNSKSKYGQ